jgi:hypothetical protein
MIQFCMASLLATMVLDDDAMDLIRERDEAPILFEACIVLLTSTLDKLHAELERQLTGYYPEDAMVGREEGRVRRGEEGEKAVCVCVWCRVLAKVWLTMRVHSIEEASRENWVPPAPPTLPLPMRHPAGV